MSKMMMGQIDHARGRIKTLKAAKLGASPESPTILGGNDVISAIREGTITVSGPRLRQAFDAYVAGVVGPTVLKESGNYRNDYNDTYKVGEGKPCSIQNALANIVYGDVNAAEIERFQSETAEYNRISAILDDKAAAVEDAIVLGDQHAALQALQEFMAFNPADFKADTFNTL